MTSTHTKTIKIDIISDIICPWCYIGKSRLYRAMEMVGKGYHFVVDMQPFMLYPTIPKGGLPKEAFGKKPGMGSRLKAAALEENLVFNYKEIRQIPNTLEAHRLMYLCPDRHQRSTLGMVLFKSYFEKGENIEDTEVLCKIAQEIGLDKTIIEQFLKTNDGEEAVKKKIAYYKQDAEVTAVPAFLLNDEHLIVGVHPLENWLRYFQRLKDKDLSV